MANELTKTNTNTAIAEYDVLKKLIAPELTKNNYELLCLELSQYDNPPSLMLKDAFLLPFKDFKNNTTNYQLVLSQKYFFKCALSNPDFDGIECHTFVDSKGELCASATAYSKKLSHGIKVEIKFSEFVKTRYDKETKSHIPTKFWQDMPDFMLKKVAESIALRKLNPNEIGHYSIDEFNGYDDSNTIDVTPKVEPKAEIPNKPESQPESPKSAPKTRKKPDNLAIKPELQDLPEKEDFYKLQINDIDTQNYLDYRKQFMNYLRERAIKNGITKGSQVVTDFFKYSETMIESIDEIGYSETLILFKKRDQIISDFDCFVESLLKTKKQEDKQADEETRSENDEDSIFSTDISKIDNTNFIKYRQNLLSYFESMLIGVDEKTDKIIGFLKISGYIEKSEKELDLEKIKGIYKNLQVVSAKFEEIANTYVKQATEQRMAEQD